MTPAIQLRSLLILCLLTVPAFAQRAKGLKARGPLEKQWQAEGTKGAVAAGGPESVEAGLAMLKAGGNAFDAAAATLLALSVTDADQFCFGGEMSVLLFDAKRNVVEVVCGQGAAPRAATREYFEQKGGIPRSGVESAAVPGAPEAIITLLDRYGTKTFAEAAAAALALLDRGEDRRHADFARTIRRMIDAEKSAGGDRRRGLRLASDFFYRGPIAREIDAWSREHGGLIRFADLATHTARIEDPVSAMYRGHRIFKCGPWTQGPYLLQTLQLLEGFDLKAMGRNEPDTVHVSLEALKLALADRDTYLADPLFESVPMEQLLSPKYAELRRGLIDLKKASADYRPGDPKNGRALLPPAEIKKALPGRPNDTTTCVVADGAGNVVAATPSGWAGALAGDTGVWLGSRLQSFNAWKGHINCIEPGKRPRITLTPTLAFKDGRPVIAISVAGGDGQDQVTLQVLLNLIDFGLPVAEAVSAPRFLTHHHVGSFGQAPPDLGSALVNPEVGERTLNALEKRGHDVSLSARALWHPSAVTIDPKTRMLRAAGDPRTGRHSGAY
jgi:gamma-glutamyltranspeptidase/glutathione hydrolase